jgi:hypothetical protein
MFVETYRQENGASIMAGGDARRIPYPKISQEDWRAWTLFLPVRSASIDPVHAIDARDASLHVIYGIPYTLTEEVRKAAQLFDNIEVWRKRDVSKDPIAVGVLDGERYLIARWGMEQLLPFETIKKAVPVILAWNYVTGPAGAIAGLVTVGVLTWSMFL